MARRKTNDRPEPRWQVLLALVAVSGIELALPSWLSFTPFWVFPTVVFVLLIPTIATHRAKRHDWNHILGIVINSVITLALMGSVVLLVGGLALQKEKGMSLLVSGAELWATNVIVFALWYWRLDGGGPNERLEAGKFGSASFVFPQMQVEKSEREIYGIGDDWTPDFVDYLFIAMMQSATFGPTDAPLLARWAKALTMAQVLIALIIVVLLISHAVGAL